MLDFTFRNTTLWHLLDGQRWGAPEALYLVLILGLGAGLTLFVIGRAERRTNRASNYSEGAETTAGDAREHMWKDEVTMISIRRSHRMAGSALAIASVALIGGAVLVVMGVTAHTPSAESTLPSSTFTVLGRGVVTLQPNAATIHLGFDVTRPTLLEAQDEARRHLDAISEAAATAGEAAGDIRTLDYRITVLNDPLGNTDTGNSNQVQAYQVSNQVSVSVHDLTRVAGVLDALMAHDAFNVVGIGVYQSDIESAADQARSLAIRDARARAEALALAAGAMVGAAVSVNENFYPPPLPAPVAPSFAGEPTGDPATPAIGSEVVVEIQVVYELE